MKTKLFTKNSYVAMLMALVLALGVQGNLADAATVTESTKSYDLLTLPSGGEQHQKALSPLISGLMLLMLVLVQ